MCLQRPIGGALTCWGWLAGRLSAPWGLQYRPVSPSICAECELTGPREPSCTSQQVFSLMRAPSGSCGHIGLASAERFVRSLPLANLGRVPTGSCEPTVPTRCASRAIWGTSWARDGPTRRTESEDRRPDTARERGRDLGQKSPTRDTHESPSRTELALWARSYL